MKKAIITPTFKPHFKFVERYLDSACKFLEDPENVTFFITVSGNDVEELSLIVKRFKKKLDIEVLCFDTMLKKFNVPYLDKKLLSKYGKFSYQTLKKFYTMMYINSEQMLVLDSESMFIKSTNIKELFDEFFKDPFITVCHLDQLSKVGDFKQKVMENISLAINGHKKEGNEEVLPINKLKLYEVNNSELKDIWFLENFVWFYDRKILNDMFRTIGEPFSIVDYIYNNVNKSNIEQGCFEICLYQGFLYKHNTNYKYRILHTETILDDAFVLNDKVYSKYEDNYYKLWGGEFGILEMAMGILDKDNYKLLAEEFKKNRFNIVRCDFTNLLNYKYQERFLEILSPNILAASQNHIYGINGGFKDKVWKLLFWNNPYARFVYKDIKSIIRPIAPLLRWLKLFYYITKHTLAWTVQFIQNINIFKN